LVCSTARVTAIVVLFDGGPSYNRRAPKSVSAYAGACQLKAPLTTTGMYTFVFAR
jgi:hypothetical protein